MSDKQEVSLAHINDVLESKIILKLMLMGL